MHQGAAKARGRHGAAQGQDLAHRVVLSAGAVTGHGLPHPPPGVSLARAGPGNAPEGGCQTEPGAQAIFAKIADVLVAQALRRYLNGSQQAGLLTRTALLDPAIARATELMHSQPARRWTIADLAQEAGMSRTAFCALFTKAAGESPIRHLARVRLSMAAGHLATSSASISQSARLAGYDNEASLSKAFKREFGIPPGRYRARTLTTTAVQDRIDSQEQRG